MKTFEQFLAEARTVFRVTDPQFVAARKKAYSEFKKNPSLENAIRAAYMNITDVKSVYDQAGFRYVYLKSNSNGKYGITLNSESSSAQLYIVHRDKKVFEEKTNKRRPDLEKFLSNLPRTPNLYDMNPE